MNDLDLRQLYTEVKSPWKKIPLTVKAGRQVLEYGDARFIGPGDWRDVSRVFDVVKVVYQPKKWLQADTFFSRVVQVSKEKADSSSHSDNFYGIYTSLKPLREQVFDTLETFLRSS